MAELDGGEQRELDGGEVADTELVATQLRNPHHLTQLNPFASFFDIQWLRSSL